eukprot:scaffold271762_cov31-Tisochrysis_lutea.AAC.1
MPLRPMRPYLRPPTRVRLQSSSSESPLMSTEAPRSRMSLEPPPERQCSTTGSRVSSRMNSSLCIESTFSRRAARLSIFSPRRIILNRSFISSSVSSSLMGSLDPLASSLLMLICTLSPSRIAERISCSSEEATASICTGAESSRLVSAVALSVESEGESDEASAAESSAASASSPAAPASSRSGARISASSEGSSSPSSADVTYSRTPASSNALSRSAPSTRESAADAIETTRLTALLVFLPLWLSLPLS